jgi:subfamily B ATP-binding cassette protein MsbA
VDESLIKKNAVAQWQVPLFLMLAFLAKGVAEYVASVSSQWIANKAITDLRQQVFRHQMHLPIPVHQAETGGRMLSRILYDIPQVGAALSNAWIIVVRDTLIIIGLTGYLIYTAWELTLVIVAIAPVVAWLIRVASRKLRGSNRDMQETTGRMTGMVEEPWAACARSSSSAPTTTKTAASPPSPKPCASRPCAPCACRRSMCRWCRCWPAAVATVIWTAGSLSAQDKLSPGEFVSFVTAMSMLFEPIRRLTNINAVIQRGLAGAQSIFELLDTRPRSTAPAAASPAKGELRFDDVSFATPARPGSPCSHFSLDVHPGQTVALVGASGSGKSTLVNLSPASSSPAAAHPARRPALASLPLAHLRQQLGWVGQQVVLFDDTVAANIAYGRPDAPRPTSSPPPAPPTPWSSSTSCPTASPPASAPTAACSPAASASASPSPAPSCATRRSCSSTKPPRPSTTNPSGR